MKQLLYIALILCLFELAICRPKAQIITLTDKNWKQCLEGQWMLKFYAPWCPACKSNEKDYAAFAEWSEDLNIKVGVVDITKEAGLSGRFMVTALPTFYYGRDGEFRRYNGPRSSDAMHEYVDQKMWLDSEPIWWLRHPNSIQMTMMSWLFKTSVMMKDVHESLTEKYGLSTWMSYAVFAVGTIIVGLVLGLILVCIVDAVAPSKPARETSQPSGPFRVPEDMSKEEEEKERNEKRGRDTEEESATYTDDENKSQQSQGSSTPGSQASQEWETIQESDVATAEAENTQGTQIRQRKKADNEDTPEEKNENDKDA